MPNPAIYPKPTATTRFAESVVIKEWHSRSTEYLGTRDDLVAVGLVPSKMFNEVGKSGTKSARLMDAQGNKRRVRLEKRAHGRWLAYLSHEENKPPYTSKKAVREESNCAETMPFKPKQFDALEALNRILSAAEFIPEMRHGEKARAIAKWTGLKSLLPPYPAMDHIPTRHLLGQSLLSKIWNTLEKLEKTMNNEEILTHLNAAKIMTAMLHNSNSRATSEGPAIVDYLKENCSAVMKEIGMDYPDANDDVSVYRAVERLLVKHVRKSLNAWSREQAAL